MLLTNLKRIRAWVIPTAIIVLSLLIYGSAQWIAYTNKASAYAEKANRDVTMLDAWVVGHGKSEDTWEGFFRDEATGTTFEYPVSGHLHSLFVKDQKAVPMHFPLSERDIRLLGSDGPIVEKALFLLMAIVVFSFCIFMGVISLLANVANSRDEAFQDFVKPLIFKDEK